MQELATIESEAINPDEIIEVEPTQAENAEPIDISAEVEERPMSDQEFDRCKDELYSIVREAKAVKKEKKDVMGTFSAKLKSYDLQIDVLSDAMEDRNFSRMEAVFDAKDIEKLRDAI